MPRIHIRTSRIGLPKLAISRRYYKIFPNYFRKSRPPIGPLEFRPRANSYFRWSSTYQLFQKKFGLETASFLIFRFQDNKQFRTSENYKQTAFHVKPSGIHFTETLSDKHPMSRPIQGAYFLGFPTLEKCRRKDAPNLSSPSPNVLRDKISHSGEPLSLI